MPSSCELGGLESDPVAQARAQRSPRSKSQGERRRQLRPASGSPIGSPERGGLRRTGPRARVEGAIKVNAAQSACRAGQLGPARAVRHLVPSSCELGGLESDPVAQARAQRSPRSKSQGERRRQLRPASGSPIGSPERGGLRRTGPRARVEGAIKVNAAQSACRAGQLGPARAVRHLVPSSCELGGLESDPVAQARAQRSPRSKSQGERRRQLRPASGSPIGSPERGGLRRTGPRARVEGRH